MDKPPTPTRSDRAQATVPLRALVLSLLALTVPVAAHLVFPEVVSDEYGLLVWLTALVPPFLLTYYRSWMGASLALAAAMVALSLTQAGLALEGAQAPPPSVLFGLVSVLIAVSIGAGWLSERLHNARRQAESMALTDGLTGLANRRHLGVFLESGFASAARGMALSVALFDLDRFKAVNDEHGHAEGDRVLTAFGEILRGRTRDMNLTGRWGGEEFLAVLTGADAEGARIFADNVRKLLSEREFPWGRVTVSVGVAEFEPTMSTPEILVAAADQALYRSKEEGRDRVTVAPRGGASSEVPTGPTVQPEPEAGPVAVPPPPAEATPPTPDDGSPGRGHGEVVLVVDDDRDARRSVSRALARFGYTVLQGAGPEEALEIVRGREEPIDLLVTDVIMPSMSGFRLVEILLRQVPTLRVVYISGYSQEGIDWKGTPGAASAFLSKPMSVEDLARTVRRVLDTPSAERPPAGPGADPASRRRRVREGPDPRASELADAHLLVIDDDADVVRSLGLLLGRCGFRNVRATTDPGDLPVLLARFRPDLVLLDMNMPEFDGLQVLSALEEFASDGFLPVVAITGETDPELRRRALSAGAADFLTKPIEAWELETRVRNLLRIRVKTTRLTSQAHDLESRVAARTAELEEARTEILLRLATAAEYRDDLTGHHAERVGSLSGLLAEKVGVPSAERDTIQRAAPLHDLGKIGVPDDILRKPGPLTDAEMEVMRQHAEIGAKILAGSRVPLLRMAREIALAHHERWDGSGYPRGLAGEDIPLSARIVAVADVFDSLTHDRPYRKALPVKMAFEHLVRHVGSLYDPAIVEALIELQRHGLVADAQAVEIIARPHGAPVPRTVERDAEDRR